MTVIYIYGLIDPRDNQVRYIGETNNIERRLNEHILDKSFSHKSNWVQSLLKQNLKPSIQIIDIGSELDWKTKEQYWISVFPNLTNKSSGGNSIDVRFRCRGEKHHKSKLTEIQVLKIMDLYRYTNLSIVDLGKLFDIHYSIIGKILIGKSWKSVNKGLITRSLFKKKLCDNKGEKHGNSKLTSKEVVEIKNLLKHERVCVIAKRYNVGQNAISRIKNGKTWRHIDN